MVHYSVVSPRRSQPAAAAVDGRRASGDESRGRRVPDQRRQTVSPDDHAGAQQLLRSVGHAERL